MEKVSAGDIAAVMGFKHTITGDTLCDDAAPILLSKIQFRFAQKEGRFWKSDLKILGFDRIREISFRPWAAGAPDAIPRRYCTGTALVSDGKPRTIHYSISDA